LQSSARVTQYPMFHLSAFIMRIMNPNLSDTHTQKGGDLNPKPPSTLKTVTNSNELTMISKIIIITTIKFVGVWEVKKKVKCNEGF